MSAPDRIYLYGKTAYPEPLVVYGTGKKHFGDGEYVRLTPELAALIEAAISELSKRHLVGARSLRAAAQAAIIAALKAAPSPWRPIAEHDGSDGLVDLWADGQRYANQFWRDGAWCHREPRGRHMVTIVRPGLKPTHFRLFPQPPGDE